MNEKIEERLRNDADAWREAFSPEIHRAVMDRLLLEPEPQRKSRKAMVSWWLTVGTGVAVLFMVVFGLRPQREPEQAVIPPQSSEVVQFFAPCGEPIRVVAQTAGMQFPHVSDEEILLPEKEQLRTLLESTRTFVNEQVTWVWE